MHQSSKQKMLLDVTNRLLNMDFREAMELAPESSQSLMMSVDQPHGYPEKTNPRRMFP